MEQVEQVEEEEGKKVDIFIKLIKVELFSIHISGRWTEKRERER